LAERLTELDGLVKHGCLPWESLMLLPVREAVKDIDILLALSMVRWPLFPEPGRSRDRYRLSKSL
jgi:hypothetical protein